LLCLYRYTLLCICIYVNYKSTHTYEYIYIWSRSGGQTSNLKNYVGLKKKSLETSCLDLTMYQKLLETVTSERWQWFHWWTN
jgi:hypothetical protein